MIRPINGDPQATHFKERPLSEAKYLAGAAYLSSGLTSKSAEASRQAAASILGAVSP